MQLDAVMWPDAAWPVVREEWRHAERLGIHRGWFYDHLNLHGPAPWHEAWTALAAVAAATSRIGVGTQVTSPNFRHPVTTAKAALSLDALSEGRFVLGIGAGGPGRDSDAFGGVPLSRAERTARFREYVDLTDRLLRREHTDVTGTFFSAHDVALGGGEPRRPPIAIAATGRRGMALAAAFGDLWITQDVAKDPAVSGHAEIGRQLAELAEVCAEHGRDPATLPSLAVLGYGDERPLDSIESFRDCVGRYGELGVTTLAVLWPREHGRLSVLEEAAALLPGPGPDA
ncbi:LLM class flavin-dependent oxidoreductase [Cryptosporangium arvum]|uniref:LLM class flavin-dependent oxidoreductase n=1 Tax=Cryptosporangium arvum TaxID=80871 RepID=UPI0004B1C04E|nr:LLM class flavin-dependent oxidoreductase [Cryptosporangium arvum]